MDKWASGKYSGRVAFVCVSLAGPELASTFVKELKLSKSTVAYTEDSPAWGQLGCGGFIVYAGDGRVASRKTAAYLEVRERAFHNVESLLDSLLDDVKPSEEALPPPPPPPPPPKTPLDVDGVCRAASGCALKNTPRLEERLEEQLEERATETCAASPFRPPEDADEAATSFSAPRIQSVRIPALDAEHAACAAALQELTSTRSVAALEKVLSAYEAHFGHEEALLDTYLWKEAAAAAAAGGGSAGGFDKSASMRTSHFADHARILRELAPDHVEQDWPTGGAVGDDEERVVPRTVIQRALQDFEAHANRYDSYGDELGAALRRAGASPAAVLP